MTSIVYYELGGTLLISLERIDPNIMKQIKEQTIQEIIHPKRETSTIRKEGVQQGNPHINRLRLKKKIKRFNGLLKRHHIRLFLDFDECEAEFLLRVMDRETDEVLRILYNNEVEELLKKLEDFIGIFVDNRI